MEKQPTGEIMQELNRYFRWNSAFEVRENNWLGYKNVGFEIQLDEESLWKSNFF